jgi:hypothetical protein
VYNEFKREFFPGEDVIVALRDRDPTTGAIREKAKFPMIRGPDGSIQRNAFARYFIRLHDTPGDEALVDEQHVRRDRKVYSKLNLRAFLKNSLVREAYQHAPWLVKEPLAHQYRISSHIPPELLRDAHVLANRVGPSDPYHDPRYLDGRLLPCAVTPSVLMSPTPPPERYGFQQPLIRGTDSLQDQIPRAPRGRNHKVPEDVARMQQDQARQQVQRQVRSDGIPERVLFTDYQQHGGALPHHAGRQVLPPVAVIPPKPAPPPIKYPIEDLDVLPRKDPNVRPQLSFLTEEMTAFVQSDRTSPPSLVEMPTIGMLLEIWNTLNVQAEPYKVDSFTFDDFVDAMGFSTESENTECQLLNEAFCAVMKQLVDIEGNLQVSLPQMAEDDDSEDSSESAIDDSTVSTPVADVPARSTRSRLSHVENVSEQPQSPDGPPVKMHKAQEALADFDWVETLGHRDMAGGNWHLILVGILYQLSQDVSQKAAYDKILAYLVPLDMDPIKENIKFQFKTMDINLRAAALQPMTLLSATTETLKTFYETCSEDQTRVRKMKMEAQKEKRAAVDAMVSKNKERNTAQEELAHAEAKEQAAAAAIADAATNAGSSEPEDEPVTATGRGTRQSLKRKRGSELTPAEKERKAALDAAKSETDKKKKQLAAIVRDSEALRSDILKLEAQIVDHDADLREADVQRTRMLGKDRFCNRYYWFERNGQPFGGLPTSSTADYGYSNGRLWVQGPDTMEREGFIDLPENDMATYKAKHQVTVPERRKLEEGPTSLMNAYEWGFFDDEAVIDNLIGWLDDRGEREKKLRKELYEWRDKICKFMRARKEFMDGEAARKLEAEEEPKKGIATRRQAEQEKAEAGDRCLRWRNTMALEDKHMGHLHSEGIPAKKPKNKKVVAVAATGGRNSRSRAK